MDPPIAPEVISAQTGIPLQQPIRALDNRHVRDMANQFHSSAQLRTGDRYTMPAPAYGPQQIDGTEALPIGVVVDDTFNGYSTTNPFLLAELDNIHRTQQTNMQRDADRRNKGTVSYTNLTLPTNELEKITEGPA